MPKATILPAAGATEHFFFELGDETLITETPSRVVLGATILSGPFAGRTAREIYTGTFDTEANTGLVKQWQQYLNLTGDLHYSVVFDRPVLFGEWNAFDEGIRYSGNNFSNTDGLGAGNDRARGFGGNDSLYGLDGNDRLDGGNGNDYLSAGLGRDTLIGGNGADVLDGRTNSVDQMAGGAGNDVYVERNVRTGDTIIERAGEGVDQVSSFSQKFVIPLEIESVIMIGLYDGPVVVTGNGQANVIFASAGRDQVDAGGGNDRVSGGAGADVLLGGAGRDIVTGGSGADVLGGNDGNDILNGGIGADTLAGGLDSDRLIGSDGRDVFLFVSVEEAGIGLTRDSVADFVRGEDLVDLSVIDANTRVAGNQAFTYIAGAAFSGAGQLKFQNGRLVGNTDADLGPEFQIALDGVTALGFADLVL